MNTYRLLNLPLTWAPLAVIAYAVYMMAANGSVYTYIVLPPIAAFHAWTAAVMMVAYMVAVRRLSYLPVPLRHLYAEALVIWGLQFYESTYAAFAWATGHKYSLLPFAGLFLMTAVIITLDRKNIFFQLRPEFALLVTVLFACYTLLYVQGFFDAVILYESPLGGPDPNMNPLWLVSKVAGFMALPFATMRGPEVREVRWLLL